MTDDALADFPVTLRWPVAWADMDAFGHVNNAVYFRWFESVRIECFDRIGWTSATTGTVGPILAQTSCTFRAPLAHPDTVILGTRIDAVAEDRFTMRYRVVSERLGRVAADGDGRVVAYDYASGRKTALPEAVRAAILTLASGAR
jgi:acyl-CoA thioester hydrolase